MEGVLRMSYLEMQRLRTRKRITELRSVLEGLEESISQQNIDDIESIYRALGKIFDILSTEPAINPSANPKYRS